MSKRYNVVDERDLADAGERLSAFLTGATSASPTIVPAQRALPATRTEHGQIRRVQGCTGYCGGRKFLIFHCAEVAELADAGDSKSCQDSDSDQDAPPTSENSSMQAVRCRLLSACVGCCSLTVY
jgi:hypothetical protein